MLQLEVKRLEDDKAALLKKKELLRDKFDLLCEVDRLNYELKKAKGGLIWAFSVGLILLVAAARPTMMKALALFVGNLTTIVFV